MNKYVKYISISLFALVPVGFIIGFSKAWQSPPSITAAGSTAVQPLLTTLGDYYSDADVTVQPGGSSLGLKVVAEGSKSLGNASKNPYSSVGKADFNKNGYTPQMWKDNGLKTVTIAWDGIAIVYKPDNINDPTLQINQDNILMLYETFAGIKEYKLSDLFVGQVNNNQTYLNKNNSSILKPYARTGGSNASGTATSFAKESGFSAKENQKEDWDKAQEILNSGNYGNNVATTNESNVESWNRFNIENKNGSIIYLSLGFVSMNRKIIEEKGYKIAEYYNPKYNTNNNPAIADTVNVTNKTYGWYSPLNTIIATNLANDTTKDFVWWLLTDEYINKSDNNNPGLIQKSGYAPLSDQDKFSMFNNQEGNLVNKQITKDNYKQEQFKDDFFSATDIDKNNNKEEFWKKEIEWYGVAKL